MEGIGAVLYAIAFIPKYGVLRGLWYGVFHSVSAFCNAGIDILGANSLEGYQADPYINLVTILLIIVSGLGFLVWRDLTLTAKRIWKKEYPVGRALQKMRLHTKLALSMTGFLLIIGTIAIFAMEYTNPRTLGTMTTGQKWIASLFQAVTTCTAGFFTIPPGSFSPAVTAAFLYADVYRRQSGWYGGRSEDNDDRNFSCDLLVGTEGFGGYRVLPQKNSSGQYPDGIFGGGCFVFGGAAWHNGAPDPGAHRADRSAV